jgi:uncharacterized protein YdhG (YjbR/CyaY superfamily)
MKENKNNSIDEYIRRFPPDVQKILETLRDVIKEAVPDAIEKISYQMPAFELHGILVYFAAWENHIGFYPTSDGISAFKEELSGYKITKGTVQFPMDKPMPYDLIGRIVKYRAAENTARVDGKMKTRERSS